MVIEVEMRSCLAERSNCAIAELKISRDFAPFQVFRGEMNCAEEMLQHYYVDVCWPRSVTVNENFTFEV